MLTLQFKETLISYRSIWKYSTQNSHKTTKHHSSGLWQTKVFERHGTRTSI